MSSNHSIKYLKQEQVDKEKWDACISNSSNQLIYGYSFYLDAMAKHWDALVLNDYEAVMPLTWNKKYGVYYLYQPFLCASLGIFGKSVPPSLVKDFLLHIPAKFRYIDISLNYGNLYKENIPGMLERKNFVLDLGLPYEDLHQNFGDNARRNIKKAIQNGYTAITPTFTDVLQLAKNQLRTLVTAGDEDFDRFYILYKYLEEEKAAKTFGITTAEGKLISSCAFFFWQNRAYYILVGNAPEQKSTGASHALLNSFINEYAGKKIILDFEGSDIPGLAKFYSSFGAKKENFPAIKNNRLPSFIKWIKR